MSAYDCTYLAKLANANIDRGIQKKRSSFSEAIVSVIVSKESSHERASNSEWLPRQSCLNMAHAVLPFFPLHSRYNSVRFLFVGLDEERNLQNKGGYTRGIARSHSGCCCLHTGT
jgi:hypothetical protein